MTTYAEVQGTTLIKYPYTFDDLQAENPFTNYGSDPDLMAIFPGTDTALRQRYQLVPVAVAPAPAYDPTTQACELEAEPTLEDGGWALGWTVRDLTDAERAAAAGHSRVAAASAALLAGVTITSTSAPSLNGTYNVGPSNQNAIAAVMTGVANGLGLPGGQGTFIYLDASNGAHAFTADQFKAFAMAIRDYVYALSLFEAGHGSLPPAEITIP